MSSRTARSNALPCLISLAMMLTVNAVFAASSGAGAADRIGPGDPTAWPADIFDGRTSPDDFSFLNVPEKPAGKHGFLRPGKDSVEFEDGTIALFWGTNVVSRALFGTTHENVRQQARRLTELGFNLARLHHYDSTWANPNDFGGEEFAGTRNLSSAMLEKLDWWIKCLKDEGIYVWLDLHVGWQLGGRWN